MIWLGGIDTRRAARVPGRAWRARATPSPPRRHPLLAGFEKVALLGGQYVPLESRRPGDSERVRGVSVD